VDTHAVTHLEIISAGFLLFFFDRVENAVHGAPFRPPDGPTFSFAIRGKSNRNLSLLGERNFDVWKSV